VSVTATVTRVSAASTRAAGERQRDGARHEHGGEDEADVPAVERGERRRPEAGDGEELLDPNAVREEFDFPVELSDADAEAGLSRALSKPADGDADAATELLADAFESVCESRSPALDGTDAGRHVACHLSEDDGE